jgi:CBS domain containing-hemolysin-like protein
MSSPIVVVVVTILLLAFSAFFVAAEFALLAAKKHRLEDAAARSRSARAALRNFNELTVLLAGCQLGITASALALGAITKPAVKYAVAPFIESTGAPEWLADGASFILALIVVTFLHLVIGEMAPKSWAIAHPESAATLLALPMRGFMAVTRPVLVVLNEMANWCLRRVGVEPQATVASGQTPDDLRQLVEHSANVGALDASYSTQLTKALDLQTLTVGDLVRPHQDLTAVDVCATAADIRAVTRASGHLRILVEDGGAVIGVVHVRDAMTAEDPITAADLMRPVLRLTAATPIYAALATMRETRNHLAVVDVDTGPGVVTLTDVLQCLFPRTTAA